MKNILISGFLAFTLTAHAQNILRVNNNPGVNAPYTTIQDAVAAANAGDIIMVDGSPTPYNTGSAIFNLTKSVTIQGPGYFLSENTGLQATQNAATITNSGAPFDGFYFQPGSDGSVVSGLTFNTPVQVKTSNITISNNRFIGNEGIMLFPTTPASNLLITGNYIDAGNYSIQSPGGQGAASHTNIVISYNYCRLRVQFYSGNAFGIVFNNILAANSNSLPNFGVTNNIFLFNANWPALLEATSPFSVQRNVFIVGPQAGADPSNVFSATLASLFVELPGNTTDTQWRLKPGSPAIGAGEGGVDCGIYGGTSPYKPSGIANGQHTIHNLMVPVSVIQNGTLNVKVSAKVN